MGALREQETPPPLERRNSPSNPPKPLRFLRARPPAVPGFGGRAVLPVGSPSKNGRSWAGVAPGMPAKHSDPSTRRRRKPPTDLHTNGADARIYAARNGMALRSTRTPPSRSTGRARGFPERSDCQKRPTPAGCFRRVVPAGPHRPGPWATGLSAPLSTSCGPAATLFPWWDGFRLVWWPRGARWGTVLPVSAPRPISYPSSGHAWGRCC